MALTSSYKVAWLRLGVNRRLTLTSYPDGAGTERRRAEHLPMTGDAPPSKLLTGLEPVSSPSAKGCSVH
jgi:hypothetical protein